MTTQELTDLMHRAADDLDPATSSQIIERAVVDGARKRFIRNLAVGGSSAAALGVVVAIAVVATTNGGGRVLDAPVASSPTVAGQPSAGPTTYSLGSETEVPDGPVIPTDRTLVSDDAMEQVLRDLLPDGTLTGLVVRHVVGSGDGGHMADRSRDGRQLMFTFNGASAVVAVGRWDGYHAVGSEDVVVGGKTEYRQKAALTAKEACGGSYQTFPAIECTQAAEGWYFVRYPNAGGAVSGAKELWVELYTDDGYAVLVHSSNTAGEKQGPKVADEPVISVPESLAIAQSARWFVAK